ncbi:MAG: phosphatase PAP2 family protein [Candidatus Kapaibacterium sp.]
MTQSKNADNSKTQTRTKAPNPLGILFNTLDLYVIAQFSIYTIFSLVFFNDIAWSGRLIAFNLSIISIIVGIAYWNRTNHNTFLDILHNFYIVALMLLIFKQMFFYIPVIHPHDYDYLLIAWDKAIFGVNPTQWLYQFRHPLLTEILQLCYMSFFFHAIVQGIEMYVTGRKAEVKTIARMIAFGLFVSYFLYLVMPAVGPRFTVHEYSSINQELPGMWLTEWFRTVVDSGDNIALGELHPIAVVNRDCMPSGHTMITLMNIIIAFRFRSRLRWVFLVVGSLLIFSTVYLRYHYVVDVLAGMVCALIVLWIEPKIWRKFLANQWASN